MDPAFAAYGTCVSCRDTSGRFPPPVEEKGATMSVKVSSQAAAMTARSGFLGRPTACLPGAALFLLACACGHSTPKDGLSVLNGGLSPTPLVPSLHVFSGGDHTPVPSAVASGGGASNTTDQTGTIPASLLAGLKVGDPIDIQANGFLPRSTTVPSNGQIFLWPVANAAESDAVHRMVYDRELPQDVFYPVVGAFSLTLIHPSQTQLASWEAEVVAFGAPLGLSYSTFDFFQYDENEVEVLFSGGTCVPDPILGFCREDYPDYKVFNVSPDRASDPVTIDRVLASWFLGPNPLPGLLNPSAPTTTLSALERQTIAMMLLHTKPTRWPDNDR